MSYICCDALNIAGRPSPFDLWDAGTDGVRLVAFDNGAFIDYHGHLRASDLETAVVIARESCANDDFGGWASFYAEHIAPTYWVLGNEMDAYLLEAESPSSWKMRPEEYAAFWHATAVPILQRQPDALLVVGGLVSGQPSYLEETFPLLDPRPYAVDVHPYGRDAASAEDLLWMYRSLALPAAQARLRLYREVLATYGMNERRLFVLEWNRPDHEISEYERMLQEETGQAAWFCWSDLMVSPFGLLDADDQQKPEYDAFQTANGGGPVADLHPEIKKTMQEFEQAGGTVGTVYTITDLANGQIANTDAGLFLWQQNVPGAQILLDARAKNPFR